MVNYLRSLPCQDGVPLIYITRRNDAPYPTIRPDLLDMYAPMAMLTDEVFSIDVIKVHNLTTMFISGNSESGVKIQALMPQYYGR